MIIYKSTKSGFQHDFLRGSLIGKLDDILTKHYHKVGSSEMNAWRNSLSYMDRVIGLGSIPQDAGVAIEYVIPTSGKRIDFLISGYDEEDKANAVIVELKQWQSVEEVKDQNEMVRTLIGGGIRPLPHPSYQAKSYADLIRDFNEAAHDNKIELHPCAFLHNYRLQKFNDPLLAPRYQEIINAAPVFTSTGTIDLQNFIAKFIRKGDQSKVLYDIESGKIRPSKSLQDSLSKMLQGNREFTMIDDQKIVYEEALLHARESFADRKKRVYIVEGGPGTGKSVMAINLLVELTSTDMMCQYITKNMAPRSVYKTKLKGSMKQNSIDNMFKSSGTYMGLKNNLLDVAIVDEAHRLNEKSGIFSNQGENQIKEIIEAFKFSVFFIDEDQIISTKDIGSIAEIEKHAAQAGAEIFYGELESQFRCNGSDGYIAWLDDVLEINQTANAIFDLDYDIQIMDDPNLVFDWVKEMNAERNRSRMLAGYCWEWPKNEENNENYHDVNIPEYEFGMSWNLKEGIWAINPDSVNQVGCIHTSQGLEFDYVGVIIGPDMRYENGKIITDLKQRANSDKSISGLKGIAKKNPEAAYSLSDRIIKNTYRTLMSRGMKACRIFCTDAALNDYLKKRLHNEPIFYDEVGSYLLASEDSDGFEI